MKFFSCFQRYERIILLRRKWLPERLRLFTAIHNNRPIAYGGPHVKFRGGLTYSCHGTAYIFASVKAIAVKFLVWENTTWKELHPLELTSKVTTEFAYNGTSRGLHKERYCRIDVIKRIEMHVKDAIGTEENITFWRYRRTRYKRIQPYRTDLH